MNNSKKELLGHLVGPNALSKLCSIIKTALAGKINTSDIVQTTLASGAAKVPSAAVTNNLQEQVDELNTNKADSNYAATVDEMAAIMSNAPSGLPQLLCVSSDVSNALFGNNLVAKGYFVKISSIQADMVMYAGVWGEGFFCRYDFSTKAIVNTVTALPTRTEMNQFSTKRTFTPHLYDSNTKLREFANIGQYYKFGKITIGWISGNNLDFSGITSMMQFRNLPCDTVLGGSVYFGTYTGTNGGNITIQASIHMYLRPNVKTSDFSSPTQTGYTTILFVGVDN